MSKSEKVRGGRPDGLFGGLDPDMGALNNMAPEEVQKIWESCKPKFKGKETFGCIIFGTAGINVPASNHFRKLWDEL